MNKLGQAAYDAYIKVAISGREKGACFQAVADAVEKEVRNSMRCETCKHDDLSFIQQCRGCFVPVEVTSFTDEDADAFVRLAKMYKKLLNELWDPI